MEGATPEILLQEADVQAATWKPPLIVTQLSDCARGIARFLSRGPEASWIGPAVSLKGLHVEGLVTCPWCCGGTERPLAGGSWCKEIRSLACTLEGDVETVPPAPSSLSFASRPPGDEQLCHTLSASMFLPHHKPQNQWEPSNQGLDPLKP